MNQEEIDAFEAACVVEGFDTDKYANLTSEVMAGVGWTLAPVYIEPTTMYFLRGWVYGSDYAKR